MKVAEFQVDKKAVNFMTAIVKVVAANEESNKEIIRLLLQQCG